MKIKEEKVKVVKEGKEKTANKKKFSKEASAILLIAVVILIVIGINIITSASLRETVDVLVLKEAVSLDGRLTEENMSKKSMIRQEYENEGLRIMADGSKKRQIILWEDREMVVGAYANYYLRQDTPVYWESLSKDATKNNAYLYTMDGEFIKLAVDASEFGSMLMVGDRINIRCTYTENTYNLPTADEYQTMQTLGLSMDRSEKKNCMLFNEVAVLDMLNDQDNSIFDIYYHYIAQPRDVQQTMMQDEAFRESIKPSKICLCVTSEEADMYNSIKDKSPSYMLSILPRDNSNLIVEALSDLETSYDVTIN